MVEQTLIVAWFFLLGATIGSFMNVVVYRLPLRMSLSRPGSHCPLCGHAIRWFDNVPVAGWIFLGGKCRDCHAPISPRYPLVEAWTGSVFALLAATEIFYMAGGGTHLVASPLNVFHLGGIRLAAGVCLIHAFLLCTLFCAAAIETSGKKIPSQLFLPAFFVSLIGFAIAPQWFPATIAVKFPFSSMTMNDRLLSLVVASAVGGLIALVESKLKKQDFTSADALAAVSVGLALGWQAGLVAPAAAFVLTGIANATGARKIPAARAASTWLYVLSLLWIVFSVAL